MTAQRQLVRLKVTLDEVEPRVERWLVVPLKIRLDRLHQALQAAMGWTDSHLWEIRIGDTGWSIPDPYAARGGGPLDARKTTLQQAIADTGARRLTYLYDFGDGWSHTIRLDKFSSMPVDIDAPFLVEAWGACPPEDCGGPWGYAELFKAIADPNPDAMDTLGKTHDPNVAPFNKLRDNVDDLAKKWAPKPRKPR